MLGTAMIPILIYLAGFVCILIFVGGYVYSDARSHGMNAVAWTMAAVLAPAFTGFILYLLVRLGHRRVSNMQDDDIGGGKSRDRAAGRIMAAVILIPVVMLLASGIFSQMLPAKTRATGVTSLSLDDYLQETNNPEIVEWLKECVAEHGGETDRAYILRNKSRDDGQLRVRYLVYMPCLAELPRISIGADSGFFGRTVDIRIAPESGMKGNTLLVITCDGTALPRLRLFYGSDKIKCEIMDVEYGVGISDGETETLTAP